MDVTSSFRWWDAYRAALGLKDFSPKSQDAVALQQIKERGALPMIDRGDIRQAIDRRSNIWASLPGASYWWSVRRQGWTAWLQNSKKRAERSERLMYDRSHRDYSALLSASSSACHGLLIITVITPRPRKPSATKMPEELKLANAAITDMQMRQRDVAALDAKYTKELGWWQSRKWCLRVMMSLVVGCISKQSVNSVKPPPPRRG